MVTGLREFLDSVAGARLDIAAAGHLQAELARLTAGLTPLQVDEVDRSWGRWLDEPGRAQALVPSWTMRVEGHEMHGAVKFGRFHVGENLVAHGGAVCALFDDVLGHFLARTGLPPARTAYLHTNFRSVTPLDVDLVFRAQVDRVEGRKRFLSATLHHGDVLCADADGLWVELKDGQP
ncbi:PaaI family thioesterase [Nocardioides sp. AE5]|uniref:PaaI family thioesterase n=1 Tax=Nocardioides sp. AE5 TaxID=2962573 RepID=UPI00288280B5|nr:PaaI family thioesterase [Nocardioides sp. AE5]MDT0200681.1 PaaI family thioesterase [Nocardioides sp. AE5]